MAFENERLPERQRLLTLSENMGQALVTNPVKWSLMIPETMPTWWANVVKGKRWYVTDDAQTSQQNNIRAKL